MHSRIAMCGLVLALAAALPRDADAQSLYSIWKPTAPGISYGVAAGLTRTGGSAEPLRDFTVAGQFTARNGPGVEQWAFGVAAEAWALPGSRSIVVGLESAVINEEPGNLYAKIAYNAVIKNRADVGVDPGAPLNANSIAYWITAQPGTGFERGLVFHTQSLRAVGARPVAIDLSDLPDSEIGQIDLIRIRKDVALRYDPATRSLVLHVEPR